MYNNGLNYTSDGWVEECFKDLVLNKCCRWQYKFLTIKFLSRNYETKFKICIYSRTVLITHLWPNNIGKLPLRRITLSWI